MGADQVAWVRKRTDLGAQVDSRLPEPSGVKAESLPLNEPIKIDVDGSARSFPTTLGLLYSAAWIGLHIGDIEKVEGDSFFRQCCSLASPVPEEILPGASVKE